MCVVAHEFSAELGSIILRLDEADDEGDSHGESDYEADYESHFYFAAKLKCVRTVSRAQENNYFS